MTKTELLAVVEAFLAEKNISLDKFYNIMIGRFDFTLQGRFDEQITKSLYGLVKFTVIDNGYLWGELKIPAKDTGDNLNVRIILT